MKRSRERVFAAFSHRVPDRTPLFELFQPYQPVHWRVCSRGLMTDMAYTWDAMAAGVSFEDLVDAEARAKVEMSEFFGLDILHVGAVNTDRHFERPVKTGPTSWRCGGLDYELDLARGMIFPTHPPTSLHGMMDETKLRAEVEGWDGCAPAVSDDALAVFRRVKELAAERGLEILYMMEQGAGTAPAFFPPFQLMWFVAEPSLLKRWIALRRAEGFAITQRFLDAGCDLVAMGGDTACDRGSFVSPKHYREFILPVIQEHIALIHRKGALAVYTSDGNLWDIKSEFFFESKTDGYKEVDFGAGMTMDRLLAEGIKDRVCILGNIDARHTLCNGTPAQARAFALDCLEKGLRTPGGHILHTSHSVHEDVKVENYVAVVAAYREFFGLEPLPG